MTRNLLDKRMKLLRTEIAEMGSLVEKQIYNDDATVVTTSRHNKSKIKFIHVGCLPKALSFMPLS